MQLAPSNIWTHDLLIASQTLYPLRHRATINIIANGGCDQQLSDDNQKFMTLSGELSWQHVRRSAVSDIWFVPTKI